MNVKKEVMKIIQSNHNLKQFLSNTPASLYITLQLTGKWFVKHWGKLNLDLVQSSHTSTAVLSLTILIFLARPFTLYLELELESSILPQ